MKLFSQFSRNLSRKSNSQNIKMEGTCNECVFPLHKDKGQGTCPTDTSLVYAAGEGKLSCVKELIAAGADVNTVCECHGNGALMSVIWCKRINCLKELIQAGADVDIRNKNGKTVLMDASTQGHVECLKELIAAEADINKQDNGGRTALMFAAHQGHAECLKELVAAGADINKEDNNRLTALMFTAVLGQVNCLKELIAAGADINKGDNNGRTALWIAANQDHVKCLKELVAAGADINKQDNVGQTALMFGAHQGHVKRLKELIAVGADLNKEDNDGRTALMHAAWHGYVECLKELLAAGADMTKEDNDGRTALLAASILRHIECLKELIDAGADINKQDNGGRTALLSAAVLGHFECIKELIAAGADINKEDTDGRTALIHAANKGHVECLKELIGAGTENQKQDNYDFTALMYAASRGHIECLKELIVAGVDVNKDDNNDWTALMFAASQGHVECLKELIIAGANINKQEKNGGTALMIAVGKGNVEGLKELIAVGAEINKTDNYGVTSLMFAANENQVQCLKELIAAGADTNKEDNVGNTALRISLAQQHVECIKELIAAGVDVNSCDKEGFSALGFAICYDDRELITLLIDAAVEVELQEDQRVPIDKPTSFRSFGSLKELLVTYGNTHDSETTPWNASAGDNTDSVKNLIGTNIDAKATTFTELLINAVKTEKAESVKALLKSEVDVNGIDKYGNTALMTSIKVGSKPIFQLLLKHGAEIDAENYKGQTALYLAVTQSYAEYAKLQSKEDQIKERYILNEFSLEGSALMVYLLLTEGAHLHETKSGLNPCKVHLTSTEFKNPNPTVLKMLDAGGANKNIKELSSVNPLQDCAKDFIREHLKQAHPERSLYFTVPQLGLPQLLQSSLLFHAVQKHNLVPNTEEKSFLQKIKEGHTENALNLINSGVDVNIQGEKDKTPLMIASEAGHTELVELLIKSGAHVNLQNSSADTALIYAFKNLIYIYAQTLSKKRNYMENIQGCVQVLLQHHAEINIQGKDGETALMHLARNTSCLLKKTQILSPDSVAKLFAMEQCMFALINAGADPNLKNDKECTALILGANILNFVKEIIKAGADINWLDKDGKTALTQASYLGTVNCIETLIESGAEINSGSITALMAAAQKGHVKCVKILIKRRADLDTQNKQGSTALMEAAFCGQVECVKLLIQEGADLDLQSENGITALMAAAVEGHVECVKLLIQEGSDLDIQEKNRNTALMLAARHGMDNCFNTLLGAGAKVNSFDIRRMLQGMQRKQQLNLRDTHGTPTSLRKMRSVMEFFKAMGEMPKPKDAQTLTRKQRKHIPNLRQESEVNAELLAGLFEKAALEGLRWKAPVKLSTLCKKLSNKEMLDVIPLPTGCPMITMRKGRRYLAMVAKGEAISLQGDKSDVKLEIKEGCPKRAYLMDVRTDPSNFGSIIPDDECFISPIVNILGPAKTETSSYTLRIPHCLDEDDDKSKVKVRLIHENRVPTVVEVPKGSAGALYYEINDRFIELHTTHFCQVICTICQTPYHCRGRISSFWFAKFETQPMKATLLQKLANLFSSKETIRHDVEIRPYFGGVIHAIVDFRKSVEATVNLRYVTQGVLKKSGTSFNPELGQIRLSMKVQDSVWVPRQGLDQWDQNSRTFTEDMKLWEVIGPENTHKCREPPFEAAIYSLTAEGEKLERFCANSKAELTLEIDPSSKQQEKKQERSSMELPLDFSQDDVAKTSEIDAIPQPTQIRKPPRFNKGKIKEIIESAGFDELPQPVADSEISRIASQFSQNSLEKVALRFFEIPEAQISNAKTNNIGNAEGFNRALLHVFKNNGHNRKDLYRVLLEAESEGILDDVDMTKVEKLILDPNT